MVLIKEERNNNNIMFYLIHAQQVQFIISQFYKQEKVKGT